MSYQDELESLMRNTTWRTPYADIHAMAENIVAAGWRPVEPVDVASIAELDALPVGSIVVGPHGAVHTRVTPSFFCWLPTGGTHRRSSEDVHVHHGPLRLVYMPTP